MKIDIINKIICGMSFLSSIFAGVINPYIDKDTNNYAIIWGIIALWFLIIIRTEKINKL